MSRMTTLAPRATAAESGPRVTLWALRVLAVITTAAVAAQPLLAGIYLDGNVKAILVHGVNGHWLSGLVFAQLIAALIYWISGRGAGWPLHGCVVLLFASGLQIGFGYGGFLAVHAPLGIAILACQLGITIWLFTPAAARARQRRERPVRAGRQSPQNPKNPQEQA